jgi:uncharacterized protein (TIGR02246 family)
MNADEQAVAAVLAKYQDALNQSDTDAVMKLYASDGVFMPQHFPSSVGAVAVRKAYDAVFNAITLTVKFNVAEIHQIAPEWANRAHQFGRDGQGQNHWRGRPGSQPRALRVSEDRRHLEDRALLFFHHQPAARMRTKEPNDDHDESSSDSRSRWARGSQN